MASARPWPFDQPRDCAVFTTRQVLEREESILRVTHDNDDHGWQFLGSDVRADDAKIISLEEAVELDPSVLQVADLPVGWRAWRASVEEPWIREIIPDATSTI
jgi:hypothetical protein